MKLQPESNKVPEKDKIERFEGGKNDGLVKFSFDQGSPVWTEPDPVSNEPSIETAYSFDGLLGTGPRTTVTRNGLDGDKKYFVTLHHSEIADSDEGRGVHLFDLLGGLGGTNFNQQRVAHELITHRLEVGNHLLDIRPVRWPSPKTERMDSPWCVGRSKSNQWARAASTYCQFDFLDSRIGAAIDSLFQDTSDRAQLLPRRKADIQKLNLNRERDEYLSEPEKGLVHRYGAGRRSDWIFPSKDFDKRFFDNPSMNPVPTNQRYSGTSMGRSIRESMLTAKSTHRIPKG